jgi:hypothetical protein
MLDSLPGLGSQIRRYAPPFGPILQGLALGNSAVQRSASLAFTEWQSWKCMSDWAYLGKARKKADRTYKNIGSIRSRFPSQTLEICGHSTPAECGSPREDPLRSVLANKSSLISGAGAEVSGSGQRFVPSVAAFEPIVLKACPDSLISSRSSRVCASLTACVSKVKVYVSMEFRLRVREVDGLGLAVMAIAF